jgi:hypothetical protein
MSAFRVFRVFCGSYGPSNYSQAPKNLIYCSTKFFVPLARICEIIRKES